MAVISKALPKEITDKYSVANNAFQLDEVKNAELDTYKNEPKDEINVIVGDDKQPDLFYPQVKFQRWTNETNFSVRLIDTEYKKAIVSTLKNQIIWEKDNVKIEFFDVPATTTDESSYKMVWYLLSKPLTNKVEFSLQSKGLDFFYQPPMNEEKLEEGQTADETHIYDQDGNIITERPENVVGSYAVYHSTKGGMNDAYGKDYKVGKAFHIYRPKLIDANGLEAWGDLNIDAKAGTYTVTIPQDFLDKAVYPIKSNDEFGYHPASLSSNTLFGDYILGGLFNASNSGNVTIISAYAQRATGSGHTKCAFYNSSKVLKGYTAVIDSPSLGWNDYNITSGGSFVADNHYLVWWASDSNVRFFYDSGATGYYQSLTYGTWPDPLVPTTYASHRYGIYATYTPSGTTTPQTQTGKSRITDTNLQTQTGKAKIVFQTQQTQTGLSRITKTSSQTQTGKSRLTITTLKTQNGLSRITKTNTQTQTGKAKIVFQTLKAQTGLSRITKTTGQTITGVAKIVFQTSKTQTGVSRITKTNQQTQSGLARITKTNTQTQTGLSRITKTTGQTQTGKADIKGTTLKTQTGLARIQKQSTQTLDGVSRIQESNNQTQTGKTRIQQTDLQTITGKSRITATSAQTQTGKASINITSSSPTQTITGQARITVTTSQTIDGKARIAETSQQTQDGRAKIVLQTTQTQTGKARISKITNQTQDGKAKIILSSQQTQTGKARLTKVQQQTQTGLARIVQTNTQTQNGKAKILLISQQTIIGKSRITKSTTQTITGKAAIRQTTNQTLTGKARIALISSRTQTGKAAIVKTSTQTQTGKANIEITVESIGNFILRSLYGFFTPLKRQNLTFVLRDFHKSYILRNSQKTKTLEGNEYDFTIKLSK